MNLNEYHQSSTLSLFLLYMCMHVHRHTPFVSQKVLSFFIHFLLYYSLTKDVNNFTLFLTKICVHIWCLYMYSQQVPSFWVYNVYISLIRTLIFGFVFTHTIFNCLHNFICLKVAKSQTDTCTLSNTFKELDKFVFFCLIPNAYIWCSFSTTFYALAHTHTHNLSLMFVVHLFMCLAMFLLFFVTITRFVAALFLTIATVEKKSVIYKQIHYASYKVTRGSVLFAKNG